jgi:hypothetical protein
VSTSSAAAGHEDLWGVPPHAIELDDTALPTDDLVAQWAALAATDLSDLDVESGIQANNIPADGLEPAVVPPLAWRSLAAVAVGGVLAGLLIALVPGSPARPVTPIMPGVASQLTSEADLTRTVGVATVVTQSPWCPMYLSVVGATPLATPPPTGCFVVR